MDPGGTPHLICKEVEHISSIQTHCDQFVK